MPLCPDDRTPLIGTDELSAGDPFIGRKIDGRFVIVSQLGAGSMGSVYRAVQLPIGREVAIKILRSDRALDESSRGRFLREARANSLLTSPNTVTVYDFGESESGEFYLVMELLTGESLGQRLKRVKRLDIESAIDTARQALRSLTEAHAKGIIHRDLKPDNLFFARSTSGEQPAEVVKVVDFGVAKMLRGDDSSPFDAVETQAGTVFGTPRYMSPEQAQGKTLDARSDLYSLGVILYHMLTGRPTYTDDDAVVVMARHIKTPPKPLREVAPEAGIPAVLDAFVMRTLAKDPALRPRSAEEFTTELDRILEEIHVQVSGPRLSIPPPSEPATSDRNVMESRAFDPSFVTLDAPKSSAKRSGLRLAMALSVAFAVAFWGAWLLTHRSQDVRPDGSPNRGGAPVSAERPAPATTVMERRPASGLGGKTDDNQKTGAVSASALPKAGTPPLHLPPVRSVASQPGRKGSPAPPAPSGYGLFEQ